MQTTRSPIAGTSRSFFHVISSNAVEIISAGPDRELFTDDDIRDVPPHATVEPNLSMTLDVPTP